MLDPERIAADASERSARAEDAFRRLSSEAAEYARTVATFAAFGRGDVGPVVAGINALLGLYTAPGAEPDRRTLERAAGSDPLARAMLAATARLALQDGERVSAHGLAALAGVTLRAVQASDAGGELRGGRGGRQGGGGPRTYAPGTAAKWLAARGVPGFGEG